MKGKHVDPSTLRGQLLAQIRRNIAERGHHTYLIDEGTCPRFAYTIGLTTVLGAELVFAGGALYDSARLGKIFDEIVYQRRAGRTLRDVIDLDELGTFTVRKASASWTRRLLLGAHDFYGREVAAQQIVPDEDHWTIDVPDMSVPWRPARAPVWAYLDGAWSLPVPETAIVATDLAALRGAPVTSASRLDEDYWELFAGPPAEVPNEDVRGVSLATFLGTDTSLDRIIELPVGRALWRQHRADPWHARDATT
ncbi:MAG: DUF4262 domain-containing protein [Deltaproteobacteria bacterium]|nr:DUF4262 domain-containing protein [Kofleriaceae bacterium]